jgi:hypothetical protein
MSNETGRDLEEYAPVALNRDGEPLAESPHSAERGSRLGAMTASERLRDAPDSAQQRRSLRA